MNKVKALFPDNVEKIIISKDDYDRLTGELTLENIELKQEIERLNNIIKEVREFVESMEYCGQEDYFYDLKAKDECGNDNTFDDSKHKLLKILDKGE